MAHVSSDFAQSGAAVLDSQDPYSGGRRSAGAVSGARRRLFRQGVRRHLPWPSAHRRGRNGQGDGPLLARRDVLFRRPLSPRRRFARRIHRCACPRHGAPRRRALARTDHHGVALARADRGEPQFLQRPSRAPFHNVFRLPGRAGHSPLRIGPAAPRASLGLRLSGSQPRDPVQRIELCPTDPPRVRHRCIPRPRARRNAAAGRYPCGNARCRFARSDLGRPLRAGCRWRGLRRRTAQPAPVPHDPAVSQSRFRRPGRLASGARDMELVLDLAVQCAQMLVVLALAPLLTRFVRKVKARLLRRQGPPLILPYRDLVRLMRKEVVLAESASWLFRVIPYLIFAATWVAAALVPTFGAGLLFSWSADLIAIIALLCSARFFLALAGLDVGTSFGGIGSSREVMIASLAEPAMIMIVFTLALVAGSTQLSTMAAFMVSSAVGLRVSLGLALVALIMVAIAENARIPVDNPATHLELTMVHEAMVLEYSGRHLALIELSASLKLLLYISLIACLFVPWGLVPSGAPIALLGIGLLAYVAKLATG